MAYFAKKAHLTPGYFGNLVRRETGTSPKEMISSYLISVAKQRLARTGADVGTIACDLGFEYPAHFSRMFKRMTGQSPNEYRSAAAAAR